MNPFDSDDTGSGSWSNSTHILEGAHVTSTEPHVPGDDVGHHVEVVPDMYSQPIIADVIVGSLGDTHIPTEGDRVVIGYRTDGRPTILGTRYSQSDTVPAFEPGERRIGHPSTDSHIRLSNDGSVAVEADSGSRVEIAEDGKTTVDVLDGKATLVLDTDGAVTVNGGTERPVTDVSTTSDADGHVTDVSVERAGDVYLPSP